MLNIELKIFLLAQEYKEVMSKVNVLTEEEKELFMTMIEETIDDEES